MNWSAAGKTIYFGFSSPPRPHEQAPGDVVRYYIATLASDPDHCAAASSSTVRSPTTIAQNEQRKTRRLTLPVLAIGGAESSGEGVGNTMKLAADDVQTLVIPGCGHWVAEQAPEGTCWRR